MGFLSKLLGGGNVEKAAKDLFGGENVEKAAKGLFAGLMGEMDADDKNWDSGSSSSYAAEPVYTDSSAPSGDSWGEVMPDEENQYNYDGTYTEYFENIFQTDFPGYRMVKEYLNEGRRVVYTFFSGDAMALVVELMPETSSAKKLRRECERNGVPYLRFYYNHHGWWNTRSYVVRRMQAALSGI